MNYFRISVAMAVACIFVFALPLEAKSDKSSKKQANKQVQTVQTQQTQSTTSTPPGWEHGKKTGWHGGKYPPGWTKWDKKKQDKWVYDRDHAYNEIYRVTTLYKIPDPKRNEITEAFGQAIAGGLVINDAKDKLVGALERPESRKALMIDTTQSVLDLLR